MSGSVVLERGPLRCEATVVDLGPKLPIATGICFLNHMIDQLVSHGQLGIGVQLSIDGVACEHDADYVLQGTGARAAEPSALSMPRPHDAAIFEIVGSALGAALKEMTAGARNAAPQSLGATRFCAPLDEAITAAVVDLRGEGFAFSLAPYGNIPPGGREWIGLYRTAYTVDFWRALHGALGGRLELAKLRGANAHHIVEATFKAFARALRAHLDAAQPAANGAHARAGAAAAARCGSVQRATKETSIEVTLELDAEGSDGGGAPSEVRTGVAMLDRLLAELASAARVRLRVACSGDVQIDDHHSAEDVAIAVGQSLHQALGTKAGCNRMGSAEASENGAVVEVVVDLSNRPHFECDLRLLSEWAGGMATEMVLHVFASLATNAHSTVHVVQRAGGEGDDACADLAIATARAFGLALRQCAAIDPRRAGLTASSKGTLSV